MHVCTYTRRKKDADQSDDFVFISSSFSYPNFLQSFPLITTLFPIVRATIFVI
jgi:hypothetical protein